MRVLYGVAGEGLGHAMRSQVVIRHLLRRGHDVRVLTSGRAAVVLAARGFDVVTTRGLTLRYVRGGVAQTRSTLALAAAAQAMATHNLRAFRASVAAFDPHVCVSDFDSFAHAVGRLLGRPVLSLDHQHVLDRCAHDRGARRPSIALARLLVSAKLPGCSHYIVSSFYQPPVLRSCAATTTVVGPIVRPELDALVPTDDGHVLVYQTSCSDPHLLPTLEALPEQRFVVYGRPDHPPSADHIVFRPFDEHRFLRDLASCRAVISNGGHTTLSEAVCLGKPVLSIPLRRHGEQQLNAAYLERLSLGRRAARPSPDRVRAFLGAHRAALPPRESGNRLALDTIDGLLEQAA